MITENNDFDKVIFIGDYFDSREFISGKDQKKNFNEIIAFKNLHPDKVILLIGNHDFHYLSGIDEKYSSYQPANAIEIGVMLEDALADGSMQMCFLYDSILFTHAGVTKTWAKANDIDLTNVDRSINRLFELNRHAFRFTAGRKHDPYGDEITQTPIWVRPASLGRDKIAGYTQVVGHTGQEELILCEDLIFIDTLGTSGQYLKIDGRKMQAHSVGME